MELLLSNSIPGNAATAEGVTTLHFLSAWDKDIATELGRKLVKAGANINAIARKGISVGGTPLMWSIYEDHPEHSSIILHLGGDSFMSDLSGANSLHLCARLHLTRNLRLLLRHIIPAKVEDLVYRCLLEAASGESLSTDSPTWW